MTALFPVIETAGFVNTTLGAPATQATTFADERESAWSLMARVAQTLSQVDPSINLRFQAGQKHLRISGDNVFSMFMYEGADALTGFDASNINASSYTGDTLSNVIVADGLRMAPPGWSTTGGKTSADGTAVNRPRWTTGSITVTLEFDYAAAFNALKTLRKGVWDVVNEGIWLGRIRVSGASLEPQGRLPGIVEARITGAAVP